MPNRSPLKPGKPRPRSYFDPVQVGDIALANRIVMAPLTRDQAGPGRIPARLMAEY